MFSIVNEGKLNNISNELLSALLEVFGNEIICALIHGSTIKGGFIKGFSDLDIQVFLKESSFDTYGLKLEKAIIIQELVGDINLSSIEANYLQMYFYNPSQIPKWYSSPVRGSYKIIYGEIPKETVTSVELFREKIRNSLHDLPTKIIEQIRSFADSKNIQLNRRVRLLSTIIFPTIYALLSYDINDPRIIWSKPKNEIFNIAKKKFRKEIFANYLEKFLEDINLLIQNKEDYNNARKAMVHGLNFLKEVSEYVSKKSFQ